MSIGCGSLVYEVRIHWKKKFLFKILLKTAFVGKLWVLGQVHSKFLPLCNWQPHTCKGSHTGSQYKDPTDNWTSWFQVDSFLVNSCSATIRGATRPIEVTNSLTPNNTHFHSITGKILLNSLASRAPWWICDLWRVN